MLYFHLILTVLDPRYYWFRCAPSCTLKILLAVKLFNAFLSLLSFFVISAININY